MSSPKVSLEQWRILHSIISEGGYAQAAAKLNKSQSSVSYAIAKMHEQLGMEVLSINGRKAELTEAGELLVRRSRTLLNEAECLEAAAKALNQGWEATITIAAEALFPPHLLMIALEKLSIEAPHTRVEIIESVMSGTDELIQNRKVDLAICGIPPRGHFGIPLFEVEFDLVAAPSHPLAIENEPVTLQQLAQFRQIIVRDSGIDRKGEAPWQKAEQRWTVSNIATAKEALINGYGFSWAALSLISKELEKGELVRIKVKDVTPHKVMLHLVYPEKDIAGPSAIMLEKLLLEAVEFECDLIDKNNF